MLLIWQLVRTRRSCPMYTTYLLVYYTGGFDVDRFACGAAKLRNDAGRSRRLGIRGHGQWDALIFVRI